MKLSLSRIALFCIAGGLLGSPLLASDAVASSPTIAIASGEAIPDLTELVPSSESTEQAAPSAAPAPAKAPAMGPVQIKINDTVNFRFGVLLQPQAEFAQLTAGGYSKNMFLRRTRFIVSGQVSKQVFFFFQTENARLGLPNAAGTKNLGTGFQTIDADIEWRLSKPLNFWAGLIYLPTSREALKASSSEFMIDTNTYAYTATTALAGTGGRDTGFMARGYFLGDRLEYRAGVFQGLRDAASRNPMRKIARLQYNFFDTETYNFPSYAGSYFGTKKILAVGSSYDKQKGYRGVVADLYADVPTAFGSALGTVTYQRLDGGKFVVALPKSNTFAVDGGVFFKGSKVGPWARFERRSFAASGLNEKRELVGLNYYVMGNNFNLKGAYGRLTPVAGRKTNLVTLQMQISLY